MKKLLFLLSIAVIISSCKQNDFETATLSETAISNMEISISDTSRIEQLKLAALTGNVKVPLEEAKELAMYTATQMREVEGITTKAPLVIKSVEVIKEGVKKDYVKTKGVEEKGDLYLFNFENNQGYVLSSADRRVPGVLAYSSYGNLGDTIYNPGQNILLERIMYYVEKKKQEFNENRLKLAIAAQEDLFKTLSKEEQQELIKKGLFDKNGKRIITKYMEDDCFALPDEEDYDDNPMIHIDKQYGEWQTVYKKAPLVKTLWAQSQGGYNDGIEEYCNGKRISVGCAAVAVGQIMGYHKKPSVFKGRTMDWNAMTEVRYGRMFSDISDRDINTSGRADIQYLLARLGDDDLLNMTYDCDGGGTTDEYVLNAFKELGYSADLKDYTNNAVVNEIKSSRPTFISACAFKIETTYESGWWIFKKKYTKTSYDGCHSWVLDGYVKRERDVTVTEYNDCIPNNQILEPVTYTYKESIELVHNNFGWGGDLKGGNIAKYGGIYGSKTGWYYKGVFDSNNNCDETSNTYKGTSGNFKYDSKIITNIK